MHIFGTTCCAYVQNKKKLDARCEKCVFVGYDKGSPAYLVYFTDSRMLKCVRCVKFTDDFDGVIEMSDPVRELQPLQIPVLYNETVQENVSNEPVCAVDRRYPQRERTQPRYLGHYEVETDYDLAGRANNIDYCYRVADVPRSYTNAISSL